MISRMIKNLANEIPVGPILWGVNHWLVDFVFVITLMSTIFLNRRTFSNIETRSLGDPPGPDFEPALQSYPV